MYQLQDPKTRLATCHLCQHPMHDSRVTAHLRGCIAKKLGLTLVERNQGFNSPHAKGTLCHVKVYTFTQFYQVVHLLVPADGDMNNLDRAIRKAWTEPCCGQPHKAHFRGDHGYYEDSDSKKAMPMSTKLNIAWKDQKHPMWFNLWPYLVAQVDQYGLYAGEHDNLPPVLAQNQMIPQPCHTACGRTASLVRHIPMQFFTAHTKRRYLCGPCAKLDGGDYLPNLNSPYAGACQYGKGAPHSISTEPASC